ncbi:uncharacterized protein LOC120135386 [Hibiscus syriacus]|uniref:uncharacterized protein LOC120135386 n=1 Tax=Hibiscus syriacus TaxID=106335 RepID=UPI00192480EF|nr:uncharacterized protein LOC120135386 [Hibiscus syriacus]
MGRRIVNRNNKPVTQLLVLWENLDEANDAWEDFSVLKGQIPTFDPWGQGSSQGATLSLLLSFDLHFSSLMQKAKKQKVGSVDSKTNIPMKKRTRTIKSPAEEGIIEIAEEINEGEVKTKGVDMPIISGLTTKFTKTLRNGKSFQIRDLLKNVNDSVSNRNMETKEHKVGISNQNGKRGKPRKSVVTSPKAFVAGKEQNGTGGLADKEVVKDCMSNEADWSKQKRMELAASQDALRGRTSDDPKTMEVHLPSAGISNMLMRIYLYQHG